MAKINFRVFKKKLAVFFFIENNRGPSRQNLFDLLDKPDFDYDDKHSDIEIES